MSRWRLKACPRCAGDVYIAKDIDGWFEQCLQCGCRHQLKEISHYQAPGVLAGRLKEDWAKNKED